VVIGKTAGTVCIGGKKRPKSRVAATRFFQRENDHVLVSVACGSSRPIDWPKERSMKPQHRGIILGKAGTNRQKAHGGKLGVSTRKKPTQCVGKKVQPECTTPSHRWGRRETKEQKQWPALETRGRLGGSPQKHSHH